MGWIGETIGRGLGTIGGGLIGGAFGGMDKGKEVGGNIGGALGSLLPFQKGGVVVVKPPATAAMATGGRVYGERFDLVGGVPRSSEPRKAGPTVNPVMGAYAMGGKVTLPGAVPGAPPVVVNAPAPAGKGRRRKAFQRKK